MDNLDYIVTLIPKVKSHWKCTLIMLHDFQHNKLIWIYEMHQLMYFVVCGAESMHYLYTEEQKTITLHSFLQS